MTTVGIVTGGARGMGLACARRMPDLVDVVLLVDRDAAAVTAAAADLAASGAKVEPVVADVTDAAALARLAGRASADAASPAPPTLEDAQRAVASVLLLELRLLLGWLPRGCSELVRSLGAWFELVNVEDRLAYLRGGPLQPAFELGALASKSQVDDELTKMKSELGPGDKQKELQQ